jgi:hypothetical protein
VSGHRTRLAVPPSDANPFAKMSEAQLQNAVIKTAKLLGWRTAHFRPGMTRRGNWVTAVQGDGAGFPDLIMLRQDRCLAIELKAAGNKPAPAQIAWLEAFAAAGVEADVWDVNDWCSGHIEKQLR